MLALNAFPHDRICTNTLLDYERVRNFSGTISRPTRISGQLQIRGRARLDHALERGEVHCNGHQHRRGYQSGEGSRTSTYRIKRSWYFTSSFSAPGTEMLNTASVQAILRNKFRKAKCLPGQVLHRTLSPENGQCRVVVPNTHLPDPNRAQGRQSHRNRPNCPRNRSMVPTFRHPINTHQMFP